MNGRSVIRQWSTVNRKIATDFDSANDEWRLTRDEGGE